MPFRTTPSLVRGIIEVDAAVDLDPFILPANELVTELLDGDDPTGFTDERLELIERWLAAHFTCMFDPRPAFEKAGRVSTSYETKIELGLNLSKYGQMAMRLDTSGKLASLDRESNSAKGNTPGTPRVYYLGKDSDEA